jgi:DNA-binding transcriptional ArsR family regulator
MMARKRPPAPAHDAPDLGDVALITVLQALSDPVRLEMVRQLGRCRGAGELGCGQIEVPVSRSTASHHLKALSGAGLIAEREEGTRKYVRLRRDELDRRFPGLLDSVLRAADGD